MCIMGYIPSSYETDVDDLIFGADEQVIRSER